MRILFTNILICTIAFSACNRYSGEITEEPARPVGVYFDKEVFLEEILKKAKAGEKLVFLDFYADWCLPCKLMDEEVFKDKDLGDFMYDHFISVKVDVETPNGVDLAFLYNIKQYPTLLFLDERGGVIKQWEGSLGLSSFRALSLEVSRIKENKEELLFDR